MRIFLLTPLFNFLLATHVLSAPWNLPQQLSDRNVEITYSIDAAWHLLDGKATGVRGMASLANVSNPNSIRADITIPSTEFNTGTSPAGQVLGELLRAQRLPPVSFAILDAVLGCTPETVSMTACRGTIDGRATVRGNSKMVRVPIELKKSGKNFVVTGSRVLNWGEYGVGDSSHWIAKLNPTITMNFTIRLNSTPS